MNFKIFALAVFLLQTIQTSSQTRYFDSFDTTLVALRLGEEVNTPYADYAPAAYGDRLYFTSVLPGATPKARKTSLILSSIPGTTASPEADLNMKKCRENLAHTAFMPDASRVYFTLCKDAQQKQPCEIWCRDRNYDGTYGVAQKLPDLINLPQTTATQPAVAYDLSAKNFVLFFVSDRPGGAGGKDIWSSTIDWDGTFGAPVCLPFNTDRDEVTPHFVASEQALYFSTNGIKGLGRFDIFKVKKIGGGAWSAPENLGVPFNSGFDDMYFTWQQTTRSAWFCSNRPDPSGKETAEGFGGMDIFSVKLPLTVVEGEVVSGESSIY